VTIFGALAGILITRPAFTKIIQKIVNTHEKKEHEHHEALVQN
jgi:hypothetical protein